MENLLTYTPAQFDVVSHILALGYAAHLAPFVFFAFSLKQVAPWYRTCGVLSMVVMVSAFLILLQQSLNSRVATMRSAAEGYGPAVVEEAERTAPPPPGVSAAAADGVFEGERLQPA